MANRKIAIIRSTSGVIDINSYNCQELGLARFLAKNGFDTDIYMSGAGKDVDKEVFSLNGATVRVFRLPRIRLPGRQAIYPALSSFLKSTRYDLIQALDDSQITSVLVSIYAKRRGIPLILWQGMYENYPLFRKRALQIFFDLIFLPILRRNTSKVICKTALAEKYIKVKGFKNTVVCPVGIDTAVFRAPEKNVSGGVLPKNMRDASGVFLYIGALEKRRNSDLLLHIFKRLLMKNKNRYLIVAGKGPYKDKCVKLAGNLGIKENVLFMDKVEQKDIGYLFRQSDIFLLPSRYEIYGMVILEAMYFGLPVLSSKTAGAKEIIIDGETGYTIDNFDAGLWAEKIESILADSGKHAMVGEKAREMIKNVFTWEAAGEKYIKAYEDLTLSGTAESDV